MSVSMPAFVAKLEDLSPEALHESSRLTNAHWP